VYIQENAQLIDWGTRGKTDWWERSSFFRDRVILLLLCRILQAMPRECSVEEIHQDVSEGFEIIPACLLRPRVGIDGGVMRRASQVPHLSHG
jgi:hypothetical protein